MHCWNPMIPQLPLFRVRNFIQLTVHLLAPVAPTWWFFFSSVSSSVGFSSSPFSWWGFSFGFPVSCSYSFAFSADPALLPERHSSHISSFLHAACALPIATKLCSQAQCTAMWSSSQSTQRHCWLHCCSGRLVKSRCSRAHGLGPRR